MPASSDPTRPADTVGAEAPGRDIASREDIIVLLEDFYRAAFADDLLGPVFVDVAHMDLASHLPRLADFWEVTLLRRGGYRGNALEPHRALHALSPLTAAHFDRWTRLWADAVEARFSGPTARRAVVQAGRIAAAMRARLDIADDDTAWAAAPEGRSALPLAPRG
ncbi:group III truncated hemoglobin [Yinghuangia seranimata]|uniref:group III truncated hemoglobin n=1 Tax=Yinghuangia seranimata TaxID=408067 RepID=UPI00248C1445|nr:group III truncated hemoglobin [Yinghuangia seranimata]MDI2132711.1 group III truncated hemoglobin [Yinghuangia seranimata]